jgi:hypothetical protein
MARFNNNKKEGEGGVEVFFKIRHTAYGDFPVSAEKKKSYA